MIAVEANGGEQQRRHDGAEDTVVALERLSSAEPALYLSPSPELSQLARAASAGLFSSLRPFCPNPPLECLLAGPDFDAEQIWQQIDLLSRPLLASLRRQITRLQHQQPPPSMGAPTPIPADDGKEEETAGRSSADEDEEEQESGDGVEVSDDGEEEEDDDKEEEDEEDGGDEEEHEDKGGAGIEDRFLKIKELEEYMEKDEAKEYGLEKGTTKKKAAAMEDGDEEDEDEDDEEDGGFEFGDLDDESGDGEDDDAENAMYEDFFRSKKKTKGNKKDDGKKGKESFEKMSLGGSEYLKMNDEQEDDEDAEPKGMEFLSTHEKELQKLQSKIKQMEKANLEPKAWTMQGEVTAAKRPKNSALGVDLDFEHNMRPPPVITEEVQASLEDLIKKRIIADQFDDVQRAPSLPSKAPKERKELDESKSQKGLAEIYEEEYAQKTGLVSAPLSVSDEQKKEASILFKRLCLKLDALSHFHFAPKPVIEDMSIQSNVPALAMEEIAPLAVSDAAMLAPEEIFEGKGDVKEEAELTQAERKRRRANKKRKFKAETAKRAAKKARENASLNRSDGNEES